MSKDTLLVVLSDMHSGSNMALFPNRFWQGKNGVNHTPTSKQEMIWKKFGEVAANIAKERKDKRVILVHNGDAIDGVHHGSLDVATRDVGEQGELHIELMDWFQKKIKWQRGDKLYYVAGTETHTGDTEDWIAKSLNAQQSEDGSYYRNQLELLVNNRRINFVHHGPPAGKGANEGNSMRNWLRDIYFDSLKDKQPPPDMVISGHVHQPTYSTYVAREGDAFRMVHGIICPSWQMKTRYAHMAAPMARNKIGGTSTVITETGDIRTPKFDMMETQSIDRADWDLAEALLK